MLCRKEIRPHHDRARRQTIYFPFQDFSKWGRGEVVLSGVESPTYTTKEFGEVLSMDAVAVRALELGEVTVFVLPCTQK